MSAVKFQKSCGACWLYSTIGVIESMNAIRSGVLSEFSTTQMLDCNEDKMDCKGGDPVRLLKWLFKSQVKIQNEIEYIQSDKRNKCTTGKRGIRVRDFSVNK